METKGEMSSKSFKVEEARREARLKAFQEQRAWRWSILGLKSRSRGIKLYLHFVLKYFLRCIIYEPMLLEGDLHDYSFDIM